MYFESKNKSKWNRFRFYVKSEKKQIDLMKWMVGCFPIYLPPLCQHVSRSFRVDAKSMWIVWIFVKQDANNTKGIFVLVLRYPVLWVIASSCAQFHQLCAAVLSLLLYLVFVGGAWCSKQHLLSNWSETRPA